MAVVVDASALRAIMFNEPEAEELTAHLQGQTLIAPALLNFELANLALKKRGASRSWQRKSPRPCLRP